MTAKPILPRELANRDVDEAITYYLKEAGSRVALRFIDALESAYTRIGTHAGAGSSRYAAELNVSGLRSWPLKHFPYLVFYVESKDSIDVWRVLHGPRDIPSWLHESKAE